MIVFHRGKNSGTALVLYWSIYMCVCRGGYLEGAVHVDLEFLRAALGDDDGSLARYVHTFIRSD